MDNFQGISYKFGSISGMQMFTFHLSDDEINEFRVTTPPASRYALFVHDIRDVLGYSILENDGNVSYGT